MRAMKMFWILAWTCWPVSIYKDITYEVWASSKGAYKAIGNGNHSNCDWEIYESSAIFIVGSKR